MPSDRASTPELAAIIRKAAKNLGGRDLSYDESMTRAAKVARDSANKGNR
jgi:hypothetical protein